MAKASQPPTTTPNDAPPEVASDAARPKPRSRAQRLSTAPAFETTRVPVLEELVSRVPEREKEDPPDDAGGGPGEDDEQETRAEGHADVAAVGQQRDVDSRNGHEPSPTWPKGTGDLVTIAFLLPWLEEGVRQIGCKHVTSILGVYAVMGGITTELRDVLTELVGLDNTKHKPGAVSIGDSVRFLVELDDLLWRGRQDWRRVALRSVVTNGRALLEAAEE